jgi:hypothetical protein
MADDPKAAKKKPLAKTDAGGKTVVRDPRYREQENPAPGVNETFTTEVVDEALRSILDRRGWPEHTKLQARHNADVIRGTMRVARNPPNRDFVFNLVWAALSLGLNSGHSAEWVERTARESGKKSGTLRRENRLWLPHAKEIALKVHIADPSASNEKLAVELAFRWRMNPDKGEPKCPGPRTLTRFIAELRASGELPPRTGS